MMMADSGCCRASWPGLSSSASRKAPSMNSQSCQLRIDYFKEGDEWGPQRLAKEPKIFYGGQKLHVVYFSALLIKYTSSLLTCSYIGQLRCCCCCFSHSAHYWSPTRKKLLYTVANPARLVVCWTGEKKNSNSRKFICGNKPFMVFILTFRNKIYIVSVDLFVYRPIT